MEERLLALEKEVEHLKSQLAQTAKPARRWWVEHAGRFANDPVFDEIVKLGREYRESQRPGRRKTKK
jgi:hypothetical protein